MTKRISNYEAGTNGAFMGFETSDSEDTENSDLEQGTVKNVSVQFIFVFIRKNCSILLFIVRGYKKFPLTPLSTCLLMI
jgi:hypothetical protein